MWKTRHKTVGTSIIKSLSEKPFLNPRRGFRIGFKGCLLLILILGITIEIYAQEVKPDHRYKILREDSKNKYAIDDIEMIDLVQALEFAGIGIHKFHLGNFDRAFDITLVSDIYVNGELVGSDTLLTSRNQYYYFVPGREEPFLDFIDEIKILTKQTENQLKLRISKYGMVSERTIRLDKERENQFFVLRRYQDTLWNEQDKIPLMIFASSWADDEYGFERFCGVVHLAENDPGTDELLTSSPNYSVISYVIE